MSERRRLRTALAPGTGTPATDVEVPDWVRHFRRSHWAPRVIEDLERDLEHARKTGVEVVGLIAELRGADRAVLAMAKARQVWWRDVVLWCIEHNVDPSPFLLSPAEQRRCSGVDDERWDHVVRDFQMNGARAQGPAVVSNPLPPRQNLHPTEGTA